MILHEDKKLFYNAVEVTAQQMKLPEIYVEKDYWITYVLYNIFNDKIGEETIFKGGTALSKCFNLIDRFSEDIDLVVIQRSGESHNKQTAKIRRISQVVANALPEIQIPGVTNKMGMIRKTAHSYKKEFFGDFGQVRDFIILEASWLGHHEPYKKLPISSYVYQMMLKRNQKALAVENVLEPFNVLVLDPCKTLCEKIISLVRFSHAEDAIDELKHKIRHIYDIYKLLNNKTISFFFNSTAFETMLCDVAKNDILCLKSNNDWLKYHPKEALILANPDYVWSQLKRTYLDSFEALVFGPLPEEKDILKMLHSIKNRVIKISWSFDSIA